MKAMFDMGFPDNRPENTYSLLESSFDRARISTARPDKRTRCSRPAFMRCAGMVQVARARSNSSHFAPSTSPVRVAAKMRNSNASLTGSLNGLANKSRLKRGRSE